MIFDLGFAIFNRQSAIANEHCEGVHHDC